MSPHPINPILLIDLLTHTDDERARLEPLLRALEQDATCNVSIQRLEERVVLAAEDELQLEAACERLRHDAQIHFGPPRIAYRETIRKPAEAEGKYIRQTGGSGNYGHCRLRIEPREPGQGNHFVNEMESDRIPHNYIQSIEQGIRHAMELGILAGFPINDVKATLCDASYHETDSKDMAFAFAGSIAFKEAARKAAPVLLEPMMTVEIDVPEQLNGAVVRDINARRGRIEKMDNVDGWCEIVAMIPLAELLRSSPHGRPEYSMRFAGYQEVPRHDDRGDGGAAAIQRPQRPGSRGNSSAARPDPDE